MGAGPDDPYVRAMSDTPAAPGPTLVERLGPRARRRAEPRASVALAGAGCALTVIGAMVLALSSSIDGGDFDQVPAVLLAGMVVAGGVVAQQQVRSGPIATAGTVAIILGVPPLVAFATVDEGGYDFPFSIDAVLIVSTLAWAAAYLLGPGRGRPAFLGAAAIGLWASTLQVAEKVFELPFTFLDLVSFSLVPTAQGHEEGYTYYDEGDPVGRFGPHLPDLAMVGLLSLALGVAFLVVSRRLDLRGLRGTSTPLLVAALPALYIGVTALGADSDALAASLLQLALGLGLVLHGASVGRRATTWIGAAIALSGLAGVVFEITDDADVVGVLFLLAGVGTVAASHVVGRLYREPGEMVLTQRGRGRPSAAPADDD